MIKTQCQFSRNLAQVELVEFIVKKSRERFLATRIRLRDNIFTKLKQKLFLTKVDSKELVKKSVRVDGDISNALLNVATNNEIFFTKIINSAVITEISTGQIDLINAAEFKHKITVYFTQEEYRHVQDALNELKNKGLKSITFSQLVRSILYKRLGIVIEIEHNTKLIEEVA